MTSLALLLLARLACTEAAPHTLCPAGDLDPDYTCHCDTFPADCTDISGDEYADDLDDGEASEIALTDLADFAEELRAVATGDGISSNLIGDFSDEGSAE